jgi:hypothetical protein
MPTDEQTTTAKLRGSDAPKLLGLLRGDLDWIVMKCLEKDRTLRYETSNELAKDLQRFLNHEPVGARPPSQLYRFRKLIRRNRLVFTSIGSVVVALLMGLLMSIWQSSRYGNIEITSEPSGASLYEKDQMMGSTPYRANNVRSGKLEYRFQLEGYQPLSLALEVGANVTTKWSVLLRKNGTVEPAVAWLSRSEAHIITLQGTVEISTDGGKRWILVGAAQSLHVGDRVRTGQNSRVQLMWSDRTVCNLGQLTEAVMLGPLTPTAVPSGGRIKVITRGATAPVEG